MAGAFNLAEKPNTTPAGRKIEATVDNLVVFLGYEYAEKKGGGNLIRTQVIFFAGHGIGKRKNITMIADLDKSLKGDYDASQPVMDAECEEHNCQVGTLGRPCRLSDVCYTWLAASRE